MKFEIMLLIYDEEFDTMSQRQIGLPVALSLCLSKFPFICSLLSLPCTLPNALSASYRKSNNSIIISW
jgi:hypothetical protein